MEEESVKQLLNDIRKFRDEFKSKGNRYYERLSNKDILFYFLNEIRNLDRRVTKNETRQKLFMWLIPICVAACIGIGTLIGKAI